MCFEFSGKSSSLAIKVEKNKPIGTMAFLMPIR